MTFAHCAKILHVRAQGLRVLATFAEERQAAFPGAPTLKESGWNIAGSV